MAADIAQCPLSGEEAAPPAGIHWSQAHLSSVLLLSPSVPLMEGEAPSMCAYIYSYIAAGLIQIVSHEFSLFGSLKQL